MVASSRVTIKDVAKRAGVSIASVSRYINKSFQVGKNKRLKIEEAIKELNYRPSLYARRLAGGKLNTFGLIIPGYEGIFYSYYALSIIREVASALDNAGIDLHLNIYRKKDLFNPSLVDGVIVADIVSNQEQVSRLIKEDVPLVVINRRVSDSGVSFVAVDNYKGAYEAVEFLINHGHKKIAHLAGDLKVQCAQDRLGGYKDAFSKNGLKVNDKYVGVTNFSRIQAREELEKMFSSKEPPTAFFCCSDEVASEVISFGEENSIKIPEKLSVIGFDDNPNCLHSGLMLTTVRQPFARMAQEAVKILQEKTAKETPPKRLTLESKLIIRDTVSFLKK